MRDLDELFRALEQSQFRRRFGLNHRDRDYLQKKPHEVILKHARDFVDQRLAPAFPNRDGKQTPMRGHPVFVAQHATASCCRGCLAKWHLIPAGKPLSTEEVHHIVNAIDRWLVAQRQQLNLEAPTLPLFEHDV